MQIFIPTRGRYASDQQSTLRFCNWLGLRPTLVVDYVEKEMYRKEFGDIAEIISLPEGVRGIGLKRDFIIRKLGDPEKLIMMDDDLEFFVRRNDDRTKFRTGEKHEFLEMLELMEAELSSYPLIGIASREGGNYATSAYLYNTRILRVMAYNPQIIMREDLRFGDMPVMEDFHIALGLLTAGYENLVLNNYCHNQSGSGKTGGCSEYRTLELQKEAALKLKEMYPDYVTVVEKTTKAAWGGGTRTDVRIQWKKAANHVN